MFLQILFGSLLIIFGVCCIRWNYKVADMLRDFDSLARFGDIYSGTKLLGVISILIGLTIVFGFWQGIVTLVLSTFFGGMRS